MVFEEHQAKRKKSEVIIMRVAFQLRRAVPMASVVDIAGFLLSVSTKLKLLGVNLDSHLRFDVHTNAVAKACKYHNRALRHTRGVLV